MTNFYTIEHTNKYTVTVTYVENIEDVVGDMYTLDEAEELVGEKYVSHYHPNILTSKIKQQLSMLKSKLIEQNLKSIVCEDDDLIEVLTKHKFTRLFYRNDLLRNGNTFKLKTVKVQTKPIKQNFHTLVSSVQYTLDKKYKFTTTLAHGWSDCENCVLLMKKMIGWSDIQFAEYDNLINQLTIQLMKQIWDNPKIFNKL